MMPVWAIRCKRLARGETKKSILRAYPYLDAADIDEALLYAAYLAEEETVELAR